MVMCIDGYCCSLMIGREVFQFHIQLQGSVVYRNTWYSNPVCVCVCVEGLGLMVMDWTEQPTEH